MQYTVNLGPGFGWVCKTFETRRISIRGYLFEGVRTLEGHAALDYVNRLFSDLNNPADLTKKLSLLAGHFALVIQTHNQLIATVDRIRSIPLAWANVNGCIYLDDRAKRLCQKLNVGPDDLDFNQVLAVAMSGYTIGAATLYRRIQSLRAGEALIVDQDGPRAVRWFLYDAWRTQDVVNPQRQLSELHRMMIERLVRSADGRTICVPLSAGLDSRFIAAGLRAVGYKNVVTFSYGRAGNHDAETARKIAEQLGFTWTFVPFTTRTQRAMFFDKEHERSLWHDCDAAVSVPFEQDWTAIRSLKNSGYISPEAIMVNGQSGDFITGNHVPTTLLDALTQTPEQSTQQLLAAFIKKHYGLWAHLVSERNNKIINKYLEREILEARAVPDTFEAARGIYEMLEYQDRQAKYVVSGQRTYEALELNWRLPLWDDDYVAFWRSAPTALKRKQNLYRKVLIEDNWGGVFQNIPVNQKTITPAWIRPLRLATKIASGPFGKSNWHAIERRIFNWWMDPLRTSAVVPYQRVIVDDRGPRNAVSYLTERYLSSHGASINYDFQ